MFLQSPVPFFGGYNSPRGPLWHCKPCALLSRWIMTDVVRWGQSSIIHIPVDKTPRYTSCFACIQTYLTCKPLQWETFLSPTVPALVWTLSHIVDQDLDSSQHHPTSNFILQDKGCPCCPWNNSLYLVDLWMQSSKSARQSLWPMAAAACALLGGSAKGAAPAPSTGNSGAKAALSLLGGKAPAVAAAAPASAVAVAKPVLPGPPTGDVAKPVLPGPPTVAVAKSVLPGPPTDTLPHGPAASSSVSSALGMLGKSSPPATPALSKTAPVAPTAPAGASAALSVLGKTAPPPVAAAPAAAALSVLGKAPAAPAAPAAPVKAPAAPAAPEGPASPASPAAAAALDVLGKSPATPAAKALGWGAGGICCDGEKGMPTMRLMIVERKKWIQILQREAVHTAQKQLLTSKPSPHVQY